jgi:hypothetical protein
MDSDSTDTDTDTSDDAPSGLYSQLREGEIRLLKVKPGNPSEPVQCELQAYSIDMEYFALSYVWGELTQPLKIQCSGHSISITRNLHGALLKLRKNLNTPLWVDSICINQSDNDEKTVQVRRMGDIYSKAKRVIIWLGEEQSTDMKGLELMHQPHSSTTS